MQHKPTRADLDAANGKTIPDVIAGDLDVLFCGINPSLYSAAIGRHFGRPGNRFWPALHLSGFTPRLYSPYEDHLLVDLGFGITNIAQQATARADQLSKEQLLQGAQQLADKIHRFRPRLLAVLGIGAYRIGFERPDAGWGEQRERIGDTCIWVLPSPSGLNANFQLADLADAFAAMRRAVDKRQAVRGASR